MKDEAFPRTVFYENFIIADTHPISRFAKRMDGVVDKAGAKR